MRITVIANQEGKIIAAHTHEHAGGAKNSGGRIAPLPGQSAHEVEAPKELVEQIQQGHFERIFHYKVNKSDKKEILVQK